MGDFNCNEINWEDLTSHNQNIESLSNKIIETFRDCFLQQVILENTRRRGDNIPSLLDLVLCYENSLINAIEYQSPLGKSDHCIITFSYDIKCISNAYKVNRYFYDKGDYNTIKICLRKINWHQLFDGKDVQQMWDIMSEILLENERMHIPNKVLEINGDIKYREAFSMVIRQKIKKKHNVWKRYMETRLPTVYRNYCRARNKVKNMIKYTRKQKEKCISGNIKNNPKAF